MNPDTTPTSRWVIKNGEFDGKPYLWDDRKYDNYDLGSLCRILNEYEEKTNEIATLREENSALKKGKVFVDPKWIYDLETQLAKAHEELCQAGLREYGI